MGKIHLRWWRPLCGKEPEMVNGSSVDEVLGGREELDCPAIGINVVNSLPDFSPAEGLIVRRIDFKISDVAERWRIKVF